MHIFSTLCKSLMSEVVCLRWKLYICNAVYCIARTEPWLAADFCGQLSPGFATKSVTKLKNILAMFWENISRVRCSCHGDWVGRHAPLRRVPRRAQTTLTRNWINCEVRINGLFETRYFSNEWNIFAALLQLPSLQLALLYRCLRNEILVMMNSHYSASP